MVRSGPIIRVRLVVYRMSQNKCKICLYPCGLFLLWFLGMFLGILPHVGHFIIDILKDYWIIESECRKSDNTSNELLESILYGIINFLQIIELLVFTFPIFYYYMRSKNSVTRSTPVQSVVSQATPLVATCEALQSDADHSGTNQRSTPGTGQSMNPAPGTSCNCECTCSCFILCCGLFMFMATVVTLGVFISINGYYGDIDKYNATNFCDLQNGTNKYEQLAIAHAVVVAFAIYVPGVVRVIAIMLLGYANINWKNSLKKLSQKEPYDLSIVSDDRINSVLKTRCKDLLREYRSIGKKVRVIYNVLEAWFMLQFFIYSVLLMTDLIHIIGPLYSHKSNVHDRVHTILYIFFDLLSFLSPYIMAVICNNAHNDYFEALLEVYQNGTYKCEEDCCEEFVAFCRKICCYKCGKDCCKEFVAFCRKFCCCEEYNQVQVEDSISEYYIRSLWKKIEKKDNFDFCPNIFGITIPISSPSYTYTLILTLIAVVFSFIQNDYTC